MDPLRHAQWMHRGRLIKMVCGLLILSLWTPWAEAQRGRGVTFSAEMRIPADGISFRAMRGAAPTGLPQPSVFHYRAPDGSVVERFLPRDLWFPAAYRGRWQDATGVELTMGMLTPMLPATQMPHLTREEFQRLTADGEASWPGSIDELRLWLRDFSDGEVSSQRPVQAPPRLSQVLGFDVRSAEREGAAYVFRFRQNVHGVNPEQWFIAVVQWPGGADTESVIRSIEQDFLSSLSTIPRAEDTAARPSDRFQHAGMAQGAERSPVYQESVERAIHSVRGLPGWWYVETPNYVLVSDLSGGRRSFVQRLQADLETMRDIYARMFPPRKPIEAVSLVRIFADADDYVRYVGQEYRDTGGVWMPGRRELIIRPFEWGNELERRARIAQIVYHEAFHQYIFYAFDLIPTSPWYNEGHATFFEGADIGRGTLRVDEVRSYADLISSMASRGALPLDRLLNLDYPDFYEQRSGNAERRNQNYALAWGLIYYLRKAAPLESENRFEDIIGHYEDALWETRDMQEATRKAFADVDMVALTASWTDFWTSDRRRHRAARNQDLLDASPR